MSDRKEGEVFNVNVVRDLTSGLGDPTVLPYDSLTGETYRVALVVDGKVVVGGGTMPPRGIGSMRAYDQFRNNGGSSNVFVDRCPPSYTERCAACSK